MAARSSSSQGKRRRDDGDGKGREVVDLTSDKKCCVAESTEPAKALLRRGLRALRDKSQLKEVAKRLTEPQRGCSLRFWSDEDLKYVLGQHRALLNQAVDVAAAERALRAYLRRPAEHPDYEVYKRVHGAFSYTFDTKAPLTGEAELVALFRTSATLALAEAQVLAWVDALPPKDRVRRAETAAVAVGLALYTRTRECVVPWFFAGNLFPYICEEMDNTLLALRRLPDKWAETRKLARCCVRSGLVSVTTNIAPATSKPLLFRRPYRVEVRGEPFITKPPYETDYLAAPALAPLLQSSADFERGAPQGLRFVLTPVRDALTCARLELLERAFVSGAYVAPRELTADAKTLEELSNALKWRAVQYHPTPGVAGPGPDAALIDRVGAVLAKLQRARPPPVVEEEEGEPGAPPAASSTASLTTPQPAELADAAAIALARRATASLGLSSGKGAYHVEGLCRSLRSTDTIECTHHGHWSHTYFGGDDYKECQRRIELALSAPRGHVDRTALSVEVRLACGWGDVQDFRALGVEIAQYLGDLQELGPQPTLYAHLHPLLHC